MPNPKDYSSRDDFMKVCVPQVIKEGLTNEQAVGKCEGMFDNKVKKEIKDKLRYIEKIQNHILIKGLHDKVKELIIKKSLTKKKK